MKPAGSLRRRLLVLLLGLVVAAWLVTGVVGYLDARHEARELLDGHIAQSAALLIAQAGSADDEVDTEHAPVLHRYSRKVAFQIWERGTTLRLHSANAPNVALSAVATGFSDATHDGRRWRVYGAWDAKHRYLVQVAEQAETRDEIAGAMGSSLATALAAVLPVFAIAIWVAVAGALRPLRAVVREVAGRAPERLASIDDTQAPNEIRPLITELNRLFDRVGSSLERERRFTADAAHELRTPLAAVRAQAQVARGAARPEDRAAALDAVIAGADRAARLVDQLLTLARLESGESLAPARRCDLAAVVRDTVAELAPAALAREQDIALDAPPSVMMAGHPDLLAVLTRNLVDNAVRYTPPAGTIRIAASARDRHILLEVSDSGPGVDAADIARLGERFHRAGPHPDVAGSGLGLSIVLRIAELHGAHATFGPGPAGRGFAASVRFPCPDETAPAPR